MLRIFCVIKTKKRGIAMLPIIKDWFESVKAIETVESDWEIESVELTKEELDDSLIPTGLKEKLNENILVDYYFYSAEQDYYVVYCLPLNILGRLQLGLLKENKLEATKEIEWKAEEKES